jgi:hypothetical protein
MVLFPYMKIPTVSGTESKLGQFSIVLAKFQFPTHGFSKYFLQFLLSLIGYPVNRK